jgi:predicted component of viral defense system (DUF524 family)
MEQLIYSEISEGTILHEQTDYGILFDSIVPEGIDGYNGVLRMVSTNAGILNFGNCIGKLNLFGKTVVVESKKVSQKCYENMLLDICKKMAELPFNFNSPTFESVNIDTSRNDTILYHTYLILRFIILHSETNLEGAFEGIFKNPARKLEKEVFECNSWEASNLGAETILNIVTRPDRLCSLNETNSLCRTVLSEKLSRGKAYYSFPQKVTGTKPTNSLDTPENRFVKYFLDICSGLLHSFQRNILSIRLLNGTALESDLRSMLEAIEVLQNNPFFNEVGVISNIPFNSTVLQKRNGYKEILGFYNMLQSSLQISFLEEKTRLVIENKDIAELYEIWTYFRLVELMEQTIEVPPIKAEILNQDEFKAYLQQYVFVEFNNGVDIIRVWYNKTFRRSKGSYSLALRPDIVIEIADCRYIFDAKFRLESVNWDVLEEEKDFTFKNGDIYKMHTYKDAIKNVKLACILYPNPDPSKDKVFWEDEQKETGVGAFSMLPGIEPQGLKGFLEKTFRSRKGYDYL